MADLGRDVLGGFINDLKNGKSAADAFASALSKIGEKLLDSALDSLFSTGGSGGGGGGLFGNLLGGLLGGARASGGPVKRGKTYLVGEEGPELWKAPGNGTIIPNDALRAVPPPSSVRAGSARSGGSTYAPQITVDARGAQQGVGAEIQAALKEYDRGSYRRFVSNVQMNRRYAGKHV
ncbi:hypothetical protein [Aureimonas leprariae]|uniref:hypothetical protein n=1 Tax=Plantimonas leprariae TaxID=2615207 RepID=UPI00192A4502|nr:hypothetical protein [Aureimonas leprariae]